MLVAPVAGRHRVTVSGTSSGEYRLAVRPTDVEELAVGGTVQAVVDDQGQQVVYGPRFRRYAGRAGARGLRRRVRRIPRGEVPDRRTRLGGHRRPRRGRRVLLASSSGWHRIVVGGLPAGASGCPVLPVEVPSISTAAPVGGSTTDSDAVEDFAFDAEAEKSVLVPVTAAEILDGPLDVTGPDGFTGSALLGAPAARRGTGSGSATASLVVDRTVAGRYQVVVTTISWRLEVSVQEVEVTKIPEDGRVSGAITADRPVEVFEVENREAETCWPSR